MIGKRSRSGARTRQPTGGAGQAEYFRRQMRGFLAAASMARTNHDAEAYRQLARQCESQLSRIAAAQ